MRWQIDDFLSYDECQSFIKKPDFIENGWQRATITTPNGAVLQEHYRNNDRHMFDDEKLAEKLFQRLKPHLPDDDPEWKLKGLNERFKIYRYVPGQNFAMHTDAQFIRNENEKSFQTILIYLNEGYEGGETEFFGLEIIPPKTGRAIVFMHHLMHEGLPIIKGTKYALRTDIMYEKR